MTIILDFKITTIVRGKRSVGVWSSCFSMSPLESVVLGRVQTPLACPVLRLEYAVRRNMLKHELHTRKPSHWSAVKVTNAKNRPRNLLMVNAVKPVSNQVKPFANMADEVGGGVPKWSHSGKICRVGKWQKVTITGVLSDLCGTGCQIKSAIVR
jgi:hypothetical protein